MLDGLLEGRNRCIQLIASYLAGYGVAVTLITWGSDLSLDLARGISGEKNVVILSGAKDLLH